MPLRLVSVALVAAACGTPAPAGVDAGAPVDAGPLDAGCDPCGQDAGPPPRAPELAVFPVTGPAHGEVRVTFTLTSAEGVAGDLSVDFRLGAGEWAPATPGASGEPLSALAASTSGTTHTFAWHTMRDLGKGTHAAAKLRLTPRVHGRPELVGTPAETAAFEVRNETLLAATALFGDFPAWHAAAADVDADGDADLLLCGDGAKLLLNRGDATFEAAGAERWPAVAGSVTHAAFGDVDGDGDADVVLALNGGSGGGSRRNRLLVNDGAGKFADETAARLPDADDQTERVLLFDAGTDGRPELFFLNSGSQPDEFLRNDGTGHFTLDGAAIPSDTLMGSGAAAADFDGDGDADIVTVNFITSQGFRLYRNGGSGTFSDATATHMPAQRSSGMLFDVVVLDANTDGHPDLYMSDGLMDGPLLLNDGTGHFSYGASPAAGGAGGVNACSADFDLDGRPDLVVTKTSAASRLFRGNGAGGFTQFPGFADTAASHRGCVARDLDGDGDPELFIGVQAGGPNELWLNTEGT